MKDYKKWILEKLLDSYENSLLFTGENRRSMRIRLRIDRRKLPEYFDETSGAYLRIHEALSELKDRELIEIEWKNGRPGHIAQSALLREDNLDEAYAYLGRQPRREMVLRLLTFLETAKVKFGTPVCQSFITFLEERIRTNASVREYLDIKKLSDAENLLRGVFEIEGNKRDCYLREFSIRVYHDSKAFEALLPRILHVFRSFGGWDDAEGETILAEYGIYHTPNYLYVKGPVILEKNGQEIDLTVFRQGIGLSGEDLSELRFADLSNVKRILTIENLTTFFRWDEEQTLIIYLGGYHNALRRSFLQSIYREKPDARYLHFGDIDAGGLMIWEDLCRRTGIPFHRFRMDRATLKQYEQYGKPLTASDKKRLESLLNRSDENELSELIQAMLDRNIKLEQECINP